MHSRDIETQRSTKVYSLSKQTATDRADEDYRPTSYKPPWPMMTAADKRRSPSPEKEIVRLPRPVPQEESDFESNALGGRRSPSDIALAERIIERERDRRRRADAIARQEQHRRRQAEAAAFREHEEVRRLNEITKRLANAQFHEGRRRTAAEEAAYHAQRAAERAADEAEIAERERTPVERQRVHEQERRAGAEVATRARPLPHSRQPAYALRTDRGTKNPRQAGVEELRRQEGNLIYGMGRPHRDDRPDFIYEWEYPGRSPMRSNAAVQPKQQAVSSEDEASTSAVRLVNPFKRAGIMQDLPLTIGGKEFMAIPDTGSAVNVIGYETLRALQSGDTIVREEDVDHAECFRLGDSSMRDASGRIELPCWFQGKPHAIFGLIFVVFDRLADGVQVILGEPFLSSNQIFTRFAHFLRHRMRPSFVPPRVMRLSCNRLQLKIHLNGTPTRAYPDTGSELDLISMEYARKRGFHVMDLEHHDETRAQLADGTIIQLDGKVLLTVTMPYKESSASGGTEDPASFDRSRNAPSNVSGSNADRLSPRRIFYVFRYLVCDVLVSQPLLHSIDAFKSHQDAFIRSRIASGDRDVNGIFKVSSWQRRFWASWAGVQNMSGETSDGAPATEAEYHRMINDLDQSEINRRTRALAGIQFCEREAARSTGAQRKTKLLEKTRQLRDKHADEQNEYWAERDRLTLAYKNATQ